MKLSERISWLKTRIQDNLFPHLQECFTDPLTEKQHELVMILETVKIEKYITSDACRWMGRTPEDRRPIARAFVAKALYNLSTTRILIELLHTMSNLRMICGFIRKRDIPSESTFSRAFAEFARTDLGDKVHAALVEEHLKNQLIGHIARDATAIKGNEKPLKKEKKERVPKRRGRPKKTEVRELKEEKRLDQQMSQTSLEALRDIPRHCDVGTKKNAKGYKETWIGYKAHIDTADCGLPITVVVTAASLHDSQVAVPMMKMTSERITYFYDLMDSAYDAKQIRGVSQVIGAYPHYR